MRNPRTLGSLLGIALLLTTASTALAHSHYDSSTPAAGDALALGEALKKIVTCDTLADTLGENARHEYLANYTPERNYETLMHIYRLAIERKRDHQSLLCCGMFTDWISPSNRGL